MSLREQSVRGAESAPLSVSLRAERGKGQGVDITQDEKDRRFSVCVIIRILNMSGPCIADEGALPHCAFPLSMEQFDSHFLNCSSRHCLVRESHFSCHLFQGTSFLLQTLKVQLTVSESHLALSFVPSDC